MSATADLLVRASLSTKVQMYLLESKALKQEEPLLTYQVTKSDWEPLQHKNEFLYF